MLRGKRTLLFVLGRQVLGCDFCRFHIRLIERVDADDRTCHCRRNLPAEEFLAEIINIRDGNAHDGLARLFEDGHSFVLLCIGR